MRMTGKWLIFLSSLSFSICAHASIDPFELGRRAYCHLKSTGLESEVKTKGVIGVVDYSIPSQTQRFWIIDLNQHQILFQGWATHGENTSLHQTMAWSEIGVNSRKYIFNVSDLHESAFFSNQAGSLQSSVGMAMAEPQPYISPAFGGNAVRMHGLDGDLNDRMYDRDIVIHQEQFTERSLRRGMVPESWGCLMLPPTQIDSVVNLIAGQPLLSYHERMLPAENERAYREWLAYQTEQESILNQAVLAKAASLGLSEADTEALLLKAQTVFKTKLEDRIQSTYEYFKTHSMYLDDCN